jgi:hypothetical protein
MTFIDTTTEIARIINVSEPGIVGTSRGKCMTQRVSPDRLHHHLSLKFWTWTAHSNHHPIA